MSDLVGGFPAPYYTGEQMEIDQSHADWNFIYQQSTGQFGIGYSSHADIDTIVHHRLVVATGYAGRGEHINSPAAEHLVGQGPPPRGIWALDPARTHKALGPYSIGMRWLTEQNGKAIPGGRSGFYIHGDNARGNRTASSGCVVLPPDIRRWIEFCRARRPVTAQLVVIA